MRRLGTVLIQASISLSGRHARVSFEQFVLSGRIRISHRRIDCVRENFGPDDHCGKLRRKPWRGFYLDAKEDYHFDFIHYVTSGRSYTQADKIRPPRIKCRERPSERDCEINRDD